MKPIILAILLCTLVGCGNKVDLKQESRPYSIINGTCFVETAVWYRTWAGMPITLEYSSHKVVLCSDVEKEKARQLPDAKEMETVLKGKLGLK
jgi:hypothetical protein